MPPFASLLSHRTVAPGTAVRHRKLGQAGCPLPSPRQPSSSIRGSPCVRQSQRQRRRASCRPVTASIGFDLPGSPNLKGPEKQLEGTWSGQQHRLLIFKNVMTGKPGQAFLKVLISLQRGGRATDALAVYGEFYEALYSKGLQRLAGVCSAATVLGKGLHVCTAGCRGPSAAWLRFSNAQGCSPRPRCAAEALRQRGDPGVLGEGVIPLRQRGMVG
ncbi:uncharacterized protein LOC142357094, partial [Convolutriloba macropyga]|uniref:uncharacterized protein LOC142357094 n=1 Tax=Convolutriloba macropyga TaxID=536237 RepID=UPI003F528B2B